MNDQNLNQFDGGLGQEEITPPAIRETEEDLPRSQETEYYSVCDCSVDFPVAGQCLYEFHDRIFREGDQL